MKTGKVGIVTLSFLAAVTFWESGSTDHQPILTPYYDAVHVLTVCDGITNMAAPGWVVPGKRYTVAQCDAKKKELFETQVFPYVKQGLKHDVTNRQFLMLADFVWGVGPSPYLRSNLLKNANAGKCMAAGEEFKKWNRAGGKVLGGLTRRSNWHSWQWELDCLNDIWNPKES